MEPEAPCEECWVLLWSPHTLEGACGCSRGSWRTRLPSATPTPTCQGGCITKLETFIQEHLRIIGAVGIGIACVQVRAWGRTGPRGRGGTRRLVAVAHSRQVCATGVWHDLHVLLVQEPEAGALLILHRPGPAPQLPAKQTTERTLLTAWERGSLCAFPSPLPFARRLCSRAPTTVPSLCLLGTPAPRGSFQVPSAAHHSPEA